ncbi:MAG TPA: BspA family leucine-rich repeat surface protein, partial [Oceanospirillales bacterium]|nr:BspA family leucine-rich repeat surface protein [Oceanospirillales bacterium]
MKLGELIKSRQLLLLWEILMLNASKNLVTIVVFICVSVLSPVAMAASSDHFVSSWKTNNSGSSGNTSITIPTTGSGYNYDVDWDNDGNFDTFGITGNITHNFGTAGTYTIRIRGSFPRIYFNNELDKNKIIAIEQWGTNIWTSMVRAFAGCSNLVNLASDTPDLSGSTNLANMFRNASQINTGNWLWDTSTITNMQGLFNGAVAFDQDIGSWNVENVSNLNNMLNGVTLSSANYDALLIGWNAQNLQANLVFDGGNSIYCSQAGQLAHENMTNSDNWSINDGDLCAEAYFITSWKTDNSVTNTTSITINTFPSENYDYQVDWNGDGDFNDPDESLHYLGNATHDYGIAGTYTIKIKGLFPRMFINESFGRSKILSVEQWGNTPWVSMNQAFEGAENLVINASDTPDLSQTTDLSYMFAKAVNVGAVSSSGNWLWDTSNIDNMAHMFELASVFNQDISSWDTANVTDMSAMFHRASAFDQNIGSWNVTQVLDMSRMFN